jgi:hypothetical protein
MRYKHLTVYCARPFSGLTIEEIHEYYMYISSEFDSYPITLRIPITTETRLLSKSDQEVIQSTGYEDPLFTDRAIVSRDLWAARESNVFLGNFLPAKVPSLGMVCELTVAHMSRSHTVCVLPEGPHPHKHAFILQQCDVIIHTLNDAIGYIVALSQTFH